MQLIAIIGIVLAVIVSTKADCNVCHQNTKTACISTTEYQQCNNNEPYGKIYECNDGQFCSILGGCLEDSELVDCNGCGKCDESKTFACIGTNQFALCLGGDNATEVRAQCSGDLVCNVNYRQICVENVSTCSFRDDTTEAPPTTTSTSTTTTSTTPSPLQNPSGFCSAIQKEGRFPIGTDPDTTCHQYIRCIFINDTWYGPIYNCPGSTYYDSSKQICVPERPGTCSKAIRSLSFRSILLE